MSALRDARVLIVEDETMQIFAFEGVLRDSGVGTVIVAGSIEEALAEIARHPPTFAMVDIKLKGGDVAYPVADVLERQGIPFVFLTGYSEDELPERYRRRPLLQKPCASDDILRAVSDAHGCATPGGALPPAGGC